MTTLVVYVHGALSTKASWNFIRWKLTSEYKYEHQENFFKYDLSTELAETLTLKLAAKLKAWLAKDTTIEDLVIVGHSFGGVLVIAAVRSLKEWLVREGIDVNIITLSSPFAGSETAAMLRVFHPKSLFFKNTGTGNKFIEQFKSEPLPCKTHIFVTVEGGAEWMPQANDGVVTVESQSHFNDDKLAVVKKVKVNHFEILLNDAVVEKLESLVSRA